MMDNKHAGRNGEYGVSKENRKTQQRRAIHNNQLDSNSFIHRYEHHQQEVPVVTTSLDNTDYVKDDDHSLTSLNYNMKRKQTIEIIGSDRDHEGNADFIVRSSKFKHSDRNGVGVRRRWIDSRTTSSSSNDGARRLQSTSASITSIDRTILTNVHDFVHFPASSSSRSSRSNTKILEAMYSYRNKDNGHDQQIQQRYSSIRTTIERRVSETTETGSDASAGVIQYNQLIVMWSIFVVISGTVSICVTLVLGALFIIVRRQRLQHDRLRKMDFQVQQLRRISSREQMLYAHDDSKKSSTNKGTNKGNNNDATAVPNTPSPRKSGSNVIPVSTRTALTAAISLSGMKNMKPKQDPFDLYLIFLLIPNLIFAVFETITCLVYIGSIVHSSDPAAEWDFFYVPQGWCRFQSFYRLFDVTANAWLLSVIMQNVYEVLVGVSARLRRRSQRILNAQMNSQRSAATNDSCCQRFDDNGSPAIISPLQSPLQSPEIESKIEMVEIATLDSTAAPAINSNLPLQQQQHQSSTLHYPSSSAIVPPVVLARRKFGHSISFGDDASTTDNDAVLAVNNGFIQQQKQIQHQQQATPYSLSSSPMVPPTIPNRKNLSRYGSSMSFDGDRTTAINDPINRNCTTAYEGYSFFPRRMLAYKQIAGVYAWAVFWSLLPLIPSLHWIPVSVNNEDNADDDNFQNNPLHPNHLIMCLPSVSDTSTSTVQGGNGGVAAEGSNEEGYVTTITNNRYFFFYVFYLPGIAILPILYILWTGFQIRRQKLLQTVDCETRSLAMFYGITATCFTCIWLPAFVLLFVVSSSTSTGGNADRWIFWTGCLLTHLMPLITTFMTLQWKPEVGSLIKDMLRCKKIFIVQVDETNDYNFEEERVLNASMDNASSSKSDDDADCAGDETVNRLLLQKHQQQPQLLLQSNSTNFVSQVGNALEDIKSSLRSNDMDDMAKKIDDENRHQQFAMSDSGSSSIDDDRYPDVSDDIDDDVDVDVDVDVDEDEDFNIDENGNYVSNDTTSSRCRCRTASGSSSMNSVTCTNSNVVETSSS